MREFDLLQHVYAHNQRLPGHVTVPPGDDMAAMRIGDATILVTVDQVADGVHVDCANTPLELVGRKAITRNLSDVAAMAALPVGAVAAACLPRDFGRDRANRLFDVMRDTAERYGCPLIGGDISVWDHPLLLTVTVMAEPAGVEPVLRDGAKTGDVIYVTGRLGGAWSPPKTWESSETPKARSILENGGGGGVADAAPHLTFEPRIGLARKIATMQGVALHSMIDLSDGLASDLGHICEQSGVAAEVDTDHLPLRAETEAAAGRDGKPAWLHGLTDGEDYELCFTLDPAGAGTLPHAIDGVPITRVGRIIGRADRSAESLIWLRQGDGQRRPMSASGWEHNG